MHGPDEVTLSFDLTVPSYLCEPDDRLGLAGLAAVMQEAAWRSARSLGFDFAANTSPVYWVLHRLAIRARRLPSWSETMRVTTWPNRIERLYARREFVLEIDGEEVVAGSSAWLILDAATGRPVRPETRLARPWPAVDGPISVPLGRLGKIDSPILPPLPAALPVRASDMDRNRHVNNARYAQWITDGVPEVHESWLPGGETLALTFSAEMRVGDRYTVVSDGARRLAEVWLVGGEPQVAVSLCVLP